jgi:hypothetical protein
MSIPNPLHVFEQNLLAAAVIKLSRPAIGMSGDSLGDLKIPSIVEKIRYVGIGLNSNKVPNAT